MNEKVYVPNTYPTPNVLVDSVMPVVSASAFKLLMVITRLTLGWRDNSDLYQAVEIGIAGAHGLSKRTGLSHQSIISASRELLGLELILVKKGPANSRTANQYALNLDLSTGQLVKNLDQSKNLSSATSQNFRPKLVKIFDSLRNKGNKYREPQASSHSKKRKRTRPALADFTITDDFRSWCDKERIPQSRAESELPKFIDWHLGKGRQVDDPAAAFRNWLRKSIEFNPLNDDSHATHPEVKELSNGMLEVDGRQMDRQTFERRYGQQATA